jgi:hypothetical protein
MQPQIIAAYDGGKHNEDLPGTLSRLTTEGSYKDLSTVIVIPALGSIPTKAVASWWNMYTPPNQKVAKFFALGMEVGAAYSQTIEGILSNPELSKWKYILTLEHDNIPPPDGLIRLLESAEAHPEFAAIGGLYFTKGPGGVAQIWGNVNEMPLNFKPQRPVLDALVECNGTGMGFTLFRMDMFKDPNLRKPWFKTAASVAEGVFTQDLYAWSDFRKHGYRAAIDCRVKVGHYDAGSDITW